jgi:methylmalonyl-CoA/ethylmalonyl-CoA epimerase
MNDNWMSLSAQDIGTLDHVALVVQDLEAEVRMYRDVYFADVSATEDYAQYGFSSVFVNLGYARLRLLQPYGQGSPIVSLLDPHELAGIHHVCYKVDDIKQMRDKLRDNGYRPLSDKDFKSGPEGKLIVFLRPTERQGPLVKLEER